MKAGPLSWAQPPCPCILPAPKIIFLTSSSPSSLHAEQHPVSLALRDGSFEEALATLHSVNVEDLHGSDKTSYAARIARFDLLRSINMLARNVTKWTKQDDFKLHHLMSSVNSMKNQKLIGWEGNDLKSLQIVIFADADYTGCGQSQECSLMSPCVCCWKVKCVTACHKMWWILRESSKMPWIQVWEL